MKTQLLLLAILGAKLTASAADVLPKINSEVLCKARSASDKMMNFVESKSIPDCIREEKDAKDKLDAIWGTTAGAVRDRCKADAVALGTLSYLDLLSCLQLADDVKRPPSTAKSRNGETRKK